MSTLKQLHGAAMVFRSFDVAIFDEDSEQIPELQTKNLLGLLAEHCERCGYDADGLIFETPHGELKLARTDHGWKADWVRSELPLP